MPRSVAAVLRTNVSLITSQWRELLQEHSRIAAASDAQLAALVDRTLAEFLAALETESLSRWLCMHPAHTAALCGFGVCSLPAVIVYFATGEKVIMQQLGADRQAGAVSVMRAHDVWHFLAQREIESHCHACHRVCAFMPGGLGSPTS